MNVRNERELVSGTNHVFVSYARRDTEVVSPLVAELESAGLQVWIDTSSIPPTAVWMQEIHNAIDECSAVISLLSPAFLGSSVCSEELEYARAAGKKVIPVVIERFDDASAPRWLSALNWVLADGAVGRTDAIRKVVSAAQSDLAWSEEHSRLLLRAREWDLAGRPKPALLRGADIARAESALLQDRPANQPQTTALQREYVAASRAGRGRFVQLVVAIAVVVALVSSGLAAVALQQRSSALDALAESDFRRFSSESEGAATQSDSIRLSLEAAAVSNRSGRSESETVAPLIASLARPDLPLVRLSGRVESQSARGERQGVDVSRDGSTLAHVAPDGRTSIVDLWTTEERLRVPAPDTGPTGENFGHQVALNADGTQLAQVFVSEYGDGAPFSGRLQTFDLGGAEPTPVIDVAVELMSPAAGLSFAVADSRFVVAEGEGTATIVEVANGEATVTHLGQPEFRSQASLVTFGFSLDGTRSCSLGSRLQMFDVVQGAQIIDLPANGAFGSCLPETCAGSSANVLAETETDASATSALTCIAPDGATLGKMASYRASSTLVPLLGLSSLEAEHDYADQWEIEAQSDDGIDVPYARVTAPDTLTRGLGRTVAVPGATGSQLISVSAAGDIDLWTVGSGILEPSRSIESPSDVERLVLDSSSSSGSLLSLGVADDSDAASVLDAETGEPIDGFPNAVGSASYDQIERLLDGSELLIVSPKGSATVYGGSGVINTYEVASEADYETRLTAIGDGALVSASGGAVRVIDPASGDEIAQLDTESRASYCAVGVSSDGARVAAVTCGTSDAPMLRVWADSSSSTSKSEYDLPFPSPTTVSLSDDGTVIAVASDGGEIALLHDGHLIQPPALELSASAHNDFQSGWAAVSPDGRWLVTRRDGLGLDLWLVTQRGADRLASLSNEPRNEPPAVVVFSDRGVTAAWNPGPGGPTARVVEWPLEISQLRRFACSKISPTTSIDISEATEADACGDTRARRERPEPPTVEGAPTTTETDKGAAAMALDAEFIQLAEGSFPRAIVVARDGTVWVAASSADAIIRIGTDGVISQFPLNRTETSVGKLVEGPDGRIWFEGFQIIGSIGPAGDVDLRYVGIDPEGFASDEDASYSMSGGADPQLFQAIGASVQQAGLPVGLTGADISSIAITAGGEVWVAADVGAGADSRYSLFNLPDLSEANEVPVEGASTAGAIAASTIDESVWFTVSRPEEAAARIGHVAPGEEPQYFDVPDATYLRDIAVDDLGIAWFTTETSVGRIDETGQARLWPIPDSGALSALSIGPDGALWVTDTELDGVHRVTFTTQ